MTIAVIAVAGLTCTSRAEASQRVWTGASSANWTDAGNWGGTAPVAGDDLVFSAGALNTTNTNDFPAGTSFASIQSNGFYTLGGNPIVLGAGGLLVTINTTVNLEITLGASQTWSNGSLGAWTMSAPVHLNGATLTLTLASGFAGDTLSGTIDGIGAIDCNGCSVSFSGANTYQGPTTIRNAGSLIALNNSALGAADGTPANGTTVMTTATLALRNVAIGNEWLSLSGDGRIGGGSLRADTGSSSVSGPIMLAADVGILTSVDGITLTLSGLISGPGQLTVIGSGTLALANGNTFTGGFKMPSFMPHGPTVELDADVALPGLPALNINNGTLRINGHVQTLSGLSGQGVVDLPTVSSVLFYNDDPTGDTTFAGQITGASGVIHHVGLSNLTLTAASTFTGSLFIDGGTVTVAGALPASVFVNNGPARFTLESGTSGSITINQGHLQLTPGNAAPSQSGPLVLGGSVASLDINGSLSNALGALKVTGSVTLGNGPLNLHLPASFAPAEGTIFTIIDNDGSDPVSGTFAALPEGAIVRTAHQVFRLSYVGGTGNDVTLTFLYAVPDYLLTEGATNAFFTTDLLLANPNPQEATASITFLKSDGAPQVMSVTLPAGAHKFLRVNSISGMENANFSTVVHSDNTLPLVVERTMSWDTSGYGAHTEHATDGSATTWYFAEGSQGFFHTYLLLANPQPTANTATVQYLREGTTPVTRTYPLGPTSRFTADLSTDAALQNQSFGIIVTFDQPGSAERAMYFGDTPLFTGGHDSAGVNAPSTSWFLAEGATGPFFETFVLLANPGDIDADATMTYFPAGGSPITATKTVPAHARITVNLETESPALANAAVSTRVESTQPILVERSQYWPDPAPNWYEAHNSFGVTQLATKWGLAEGRIGNVDGASNAQTYILLVNPGTTAANVSITFLRDDATTNVTKTFAIPPTTRFNVTVGPGTFVPELTNEHFGAVITADQPIAVERAVYWDAIGQIWAAGTNATAMRLP